MAFKLSPSLLLLLLFLLNSAIPCVLGFGVFQVKHKFTTQAQRRNLHLLRAHDARRHGWLLSADHLSISGHGLPRRIGKLSRSGVKFGKKEANLDLVDNVAVGEEGLKETAGKGTVSLLIRPEALRVGLSEETVTGILKEGPDLRVGTTQSTQEITAARVTGDDNSGSG